MTQLAYLDTSIEHKEWEVVTLPISGNVTELKCEGRTIFAHASSGQLAISNNGGATWELSRERHKFRRYKRKKCK